MKKKAKFFEKTVKTDGNIKLNVSSTTTSIVSAGGKETKGKAGAAITLTDPDGKQLTALFTESQLCNLIVALKALGRHLISKNHPCPF